MTTWNPGKLVRNLVSGSDPEAFWSSGFRLTAWGVSGIFVGYLAYDFNRWWAGQGESGLWTMAAETGRKIVATVLSLRGLEGLVADFRRRR